MSNHIDVKLAFETLARIMAQATGAEVEVTITRKTDAAQQKNA